MYRVTRYFYMLLCSPAVLVERQFVTTPRGTCLALACQTKRAHGTYTHLRVRDELFLARVRVLSRVCTTVARGWTSGLEQHIRRARYLSTSRVGRAVPRYLPVVCSLARVPLRRIQRVSHVWGNNRGWCSVWVVLDVTRENSSRSDVVKMKQIREAIPSQRLASV
jgi:hypothetical protein